MLLYPLKFKPIYKEKIWGGSNLKKYLNKNIDENKKIGESWEIADHFEDTTVVLNGELKGKTLHELLLEYKRDLLGNSADDKFLEKFPLLIKFIDANDKLSVQVHPDDEYAFKNENGEMGKTEMWYIVHAEPNTKLIAGVREGVNRELFKEKLLTNKLEEVVNFVEVKTGDVIFIPAGRLHAITSSIVLNEIQQNSDVTYRVYDWGRVGFDGKPRELHIEKSLDVINFNDTNVGIEKYETIKDGKNFISKLLSCDFFIVEKYDLEEEFKFNLDGESFNIFSVIDGKGIVKMKNFQLDIYKGESILIPACIKEYRIDVLDKLTLIRSFLP